MRCTSAKTVQIAPRMNGISETQTFYLGGLRLNKTLASLKFRVKTIRNLLLLREHERQLSNTNALVAAMLDFEKLKELGNEYFQHEDSWEANDSFPVALHGIRHTVNTSRWARKGATNCWEQVH